MTAEQKKIIIKILQAEADKMIKDLECQELIFRIWQDKKNNIRPEKFPSEEEYKSYLKLWEDNRPADIEYNRNNTFNLIKAIDELKNIL